MQKKELSGLVYSSITGHGKGEPKQKALRVQIPKAKQIQKTSIGIEYETDTFASIHYSNK
ncbi:MAG: hypothetical protein GX587_07235 [Bacteroidales bacterium]|nr:hypothetical protein [Bacteroidales bacterium]